MLKALARQVSDYHLPEAFDNANTFDAFSEELGVSTDEEEALSLSLVVRMKEKIQSQKESSDDEDEESDFEEED